MANEIRICAHVDCKCTLGDDAIKRDKLYYCDEGCYLGEGCGHENCQCEAVFAHSHKDDPVFISWF